MLRADLESPGQPGLSVFCKLSKVCFDANVYTQIVPQDQEITTGDTPVQELFDAIRALTKPPKPKRNPIGLGTVANSCHNLLLNTYLP